jgi:hypothetical protein
MGVYMIVRLLRCGLCAGVILFLAGCGESISPQQRVSMYLDSLRNKNYEKQFESLCEEEQKKVSIDEWKKAPYFAAVDFLARNQTYAIADSEIKDTAAIVTVRITAPDRRAVRMIRLSDEVKDKSEREAFEIMSTKYKDQIPYKTDMATFSLRKEKGAWKICFDDAAM